MRDLLKEDAEFIWDERLRTALQKIKDAITSQLVLAFFDPKKEVRLQVDASKFGLGAAIFQSSSASSKKESAIVVLQESVTKIS